MIRRTTIPLNSIHQTGAAMGRLAIEYARDMAPYAALPVTEVQRIVRQIPYVRDPEGEEAVHRPWITLMGRGIGRDCDDKSICMGAWARLRGYPFRFVAVGRGTPGSKSKYHHVFCEIDLPGYGWTRVDATYDHDRIGVWKEYRNRCVIFTTEARA